MAGSTPNTLTKKQEQTILALLAHPTVTKAAEAVKIGERTIYRWLDEPLFSREYMKARRQTFSQAIALTMRYAPMAVQALAKVMTDPEAPSASRVSAASAILKFSRDSLEIDDLAQRVAALENPGGPPPPGKGPGGRTKPGREPGPGTAPNADTGQQEAA